MALYIDITSSLLPQGTPFGALHIERALTLRLLRHRRGEVKLCFAHPVSQKFHEIHRPIALRILNGELHAKAGDLATLPSHYAHQCLTEVDAFRNDLASGLSVSRAMTRLEARTSFFSAQDFLSLRQDFTPSPLQGGAQDLLVDFSTGEAPLTPDDVVVTTGANATQIDMRQIRQSKERAGFRYIAAIHNFDPLGNPHLVPHSILHNERVYLGELIWTADQLICFSETTKTYVQKYLNSWNIKTSVEKISPGYGHLLDGRNKETYTTIIPGKFFFQVSDSHSHENHQIVLKAFERSILDSSVPPNLKYVFAYREFAPDERTICQVRESSVLKDKVIFFKINSDRDLIDLYRMAKFVVISTTSNGYNFDLSIAISLNKHCIASRIDELNKNGGDSVFYADPYNCNEWKLHIENLSNDDFEIKKELYEDIRPNLINQWDCIVEDFYRILNQSVS